MTTIIHVHHAYTDSLRKESVICVAGNICQEKISPISLSLLVGENLIHDFFFVPVNDYIEDAVTFTVLAKINLAKY